MHQLMRRVALGMTLPLVVGAPVVLLAGPAFAEGMTETTVTLPAPSAVYGQEVHATATVTAYPSTPVSDGTVQFYVRHDGVSEEPWQVGSAVPLTASGTAISPALTMSDGTPLDVDATLYEVSADYQPGTYDPSSGFSANDLQITKAASSVAVLPTATTLVADVTGAFPGGIQANSIKPIGAVEFKVNGAVVGSNDLVNGKATLNHVLAAGPQTVTATYTGDDQYTGTSEALVRKDPILGARVLSTFPKSKSGWYHTPVDIWFICKPQGSELVEDCPVDTSLNQSGKNQSVTRTIRAVDGGSATLTISGIDIDRDKPVIKVNGRSCTATDKLSGVKGKCRMEIAKNGHYTAVAKDKAGNRAVKRGILD
jgi:hypothetical protein